MNTRNQFTNSRTFLILVFALAALPAPRAALAANFAVVRGLTGQALISTSNAPAELLAVGAKVRAGDVIKTGVRSAVDLDLGGDAGIVRLTQHTHLRIEKLEVPESKPSLATDIQLALENGTILGAGNKSGFKASCHVKVSNGVAAIGSGLYRLNSQGYAVAVDGSVILAHIGSDGAIKPHELRAPPAVYFSPIEGVRSAPPPLVKEVEGQWKAKLKTVLKGTR